MKRKVLHCCLWALAFVAIEALLIAYVDRPLSAYMRTLDVRAPNLIDFFRRVTVLALSKWYLWPSGLALLSIAVLVRLPLLNPDWRLRLCRLAHHLFYFFASIALSGIVTDTLKPLIGRARPVVLTRDNLYGFHPLTFFPAWNSLPSGHATTAAALATVLTIFFPRGRFLWWLAGAILAASRVMVNAHYLADIVAGALIGTIVSFWLKTQRTHQGMFPLIEGICPIDVAPKRR